MITPRDQLKFNAGQWAEYAARAASEGLPEAAQFAQRAEAAWQRWHMSESMTDAQAHTREHTNEGIP